jgi:hypothetical protein
MNVRRTLLLSCAAVVLHGAAAAPQPPKPAPASAAPAPAPAPAKPTAPRAKPTPAPSPFVEGIVRGPDRKPLEKALVMAAAESSRLARFMGGAQPPVSMRTGTDGRFRLTLRSAQPHTVRVEAAGLAAQSRKDVSPGTSLTFDLTRGGTIEGVVRDESGQPVARARVEARGSDAIALPGEPSAGRVTAETAADGRFKLEGLAAGLHTVMARSRMAGFASRSNVRLGTRVELVVFPAATVSGTVTDAAGKPVPRAVVSIAARPFGRNPMTEAADDLGRYELNGLDAGLYDVIARAPAWRQASRPRSRWTAAARRAWTWCCGRACG